MNDNKTELIIKVLELAIKYGVPAVKNVIETWTNDQEITPEMIEAKIRKLPTPSSFFDK